MSNHIFIVCSPLQFRIAKMIKERYGADHFHIIYLQTKAGVKPSIKSELQEYFNTYLIADMDYGFFNFLKIARYIKNLACQNGYIYLANANDLTIQYIVSQVCPPLKIRTFDDGILNINTILDVNHKIKEKRKFKYFLTRLFFTNRFSIKKIIDSSERHYTILDDDRTRNVRSELVKLDMFNREIGISDHERSSSDKVVNIFIGSRFKDILRHKNNVNLEKLIAKIYALNSVFTDLIYLRHPRETSPDSLNMAEESVDSISEDYIYSLVSQGAHVNVVGFASTCQLNVMNLPNVNVTLLETELIRADILDSFSLFNQSNVKIYNLDAQK